MTFGVAHNYHLYSLFSQATTIYSQYVYDYNEDFGHIAASWVFHMVSLLCFKNSVGGIYVLELRFSRVIGLHIPVDL